jgi:hypothetical protein
MQLRMPGRPVQTLSRGAQDLLSFNYQLGLMDNLASGSQLPIATGKKYAAYRLEVVGDEDIETPGRDVSLPAPACTGSGDDRALAGLRSCTCCR